MPAGRIKIVLVGGGSCTWSPKLIRDCLLTPGLDRAHYQILRRSSAIRSAGT